MGVSESSVKSQRGIRKLCWEEETGIWKYSKSAFPDFPTYINCVHFQTLSLQTQKVKFSMNEAVMDLVHSHC